MMKLVGKKDPNASTAVINDLTGQYIFVINGWYKSEIHPDGRFILAEIPDGELRIKLNEVAGWPELNEKG